MTLKIKKTITGIGRQLISVFLVLVISLMLVTSPALAANSVILTNDNYEYLVLEAVKPVIVILASKSVVEGFGTSLEELKTKAENFFGVKFKVAVGNLDEGLEIAEKAVIPIFPMTAALSVFESGEVTKLAAILDPKDPTAAFEVIKDYLTQ